jgi:small-conductance mechanosensitive channel
VRRLTAWVALCDREVEDVDGLRTARNRLKEELGGRVSLFSWRDVRATAWTKMEAAWDYEVFSVKDQPVRVRTILAVMLLIVLGHWASRRSSRLVGRVVFRRWGMGHGRRAAWETLLYYGLFLVVLLTAFNLFHVSLTQFSVVSGALAVGIGFGSQNLIGNFISGVILLVERPINEGDLIEIDGQQMKVQSLGPRSTIVRTFDNTHVIVPNSRLLEQPVTNWTLSDEVVRRKIRLGVTHAAATREVDRVLMATMAGMETVLKNPAPSVVFADFGENALIFEAMFWVSLEERTDVVTELRHRFAEALAKAGVALAVPRRDVRLERAEAGQSEVARTAPPER